MEPDAGSTNMETDSANIESEMEIDSVNMVTETVNAEIDGVINVVTETFVNMEINAVNMEIDMKPDNTDMENDNINKEKTTGTCRGQHEDENSMALR